MQYRQFQHPFQPNNFQYVILDNDGGGDDCQAILALDYFIKKSGKILLGIVCSNGNVDVSNTTDNCLIAQKICHSKYPLFPGNNQGMSGFVDKNFYFGEDGIGNKQAQFLSEIEVDRTKVQNQKAYKFIVDSALKFKGQIAYICIGPLSNLATAVLYEPLIKECFTNIVIMGGADTLLGFEPSFTSEFNFNLDSEAAFIVFEEFQNIILVTYDTSCSSISPSQSQCLFKNYSTQKSRFIQRIYDFQYLKDPPGIPEVVDPLTIMALFCPDSVKSGMNVKIKICTQGNRTKGATIIDYFSKQAKVQPNTYLIKIVPY